MNTNSFHKTQQQKKEDRQLAQQRIRKDNLIKTLYLAGFMATLPTYLISELVPENTSKDVKFIIILMTFFIVQIVSVILLRSYIKRNPDSPWRNLID